MDSKLLLMIMANRLYEDIRFVTEQNPTQIVDDDGARAYNSLLQKVRKQFPHVDHVGDFCDWSPRTIKYKDALVVAGQLAAMVHALVQPQSAMPLSRPTPAAAITPSGVPLSASFYEKELYGSSEPPKRNEDGTIPFSLE